MRHAVGFELKTQNSELKTQCSPQSSKTRTLSDTMAGEYWSRLVGRANDTDRTHLLHRRQPVLGRGVVSRPGVPVVPAEPRAGSAAGAARAGDVPDLGVSARGADR